MEQVLSFIQNHLALAGAWLLCALAIIIFEIKNRADAPAKLSPHQLVERMNEGGIKLIDIRKPELFRNAHILNAKNIPWNEKDEAAFNSLNQDQIVFVCEQGHTALQLAIKLKKQGLQNLQVLAGGLAAWKQNHLPLVKGK